MVDETNIRASSLPSYPICPLKWAGDQLRGELEAYGYEVKRLPRGIGAQNGTAVHAAAAHILQTKIDTGGSICRDTDAVDLAIDTLEESINEEGEISWDDTTPSLNDAQKQIRRQVRSYHTHLAPKLEPLQVEVELKARIKPGFLMVGHPDLLENIDISDLKTGRMPFIYAAQYGAYGLLVRAQKDGGGARKYGQARDMIEHHVPRTKKDEQPPPTIYRYEGGRAERQATRIIKKIVDDIETFRDLAESGKGGPEDAFLPNPNQFLCSNKFCRLWGTKTCGAWKRKG